MELSNVINNINNERKFYLKDNSNFFPKVISNIIYEYDYYPIGKLEAIATENTSKILDTNELSDGSIVSLTIGQFQEINIYTPSLQIIKTISLNNYLTYNYRLKILSNDNILIQLDNTILILDTSGTLILEHNNPDYIRFVNILSNDLILITSLKHYGSIIRLLNLNTKSIKEYLFDFQMTTINVFPENNLIFAYGQDLCPTINNIMLCKINNDTIKIVLDTKNNNIKSKIFNKEEVKIQFTHKLLNDTIFTFGVYTNINNLKLHDFHTQWMSIIDQNGKIIKEEEFRPSQIDEIFIFSEFKNNITLFSKDTIYTLNPETLTITKLIQLQINISSCKIYERITNIDMILVFPLITIILNPITGNYRQIFVTNADIYSLFILKNLKMLFTTYEGQIQLIN